MKRLFFALVFTIFSFSPGYAQEVREFTTINYTRAELNCLARAIYHEARGEGVQGMALVGAVLHNRVLSDQFPNTFCRVKRQPYQFSFVHQLDDLTMQEKEARETAFYIAHIILTQPQEPLFNNILFFHSGPRPRSWHSEKLVKEVQYQRHVFYRLASI